MAIVSRAREAGRHHTGGRETITIFDEFLTLIYQRRGVPSRAVVWSLESLRSLESLWSLESGVRSLESGVTPESAVWRLESLWSLQSGATPESGVWMLKLSFAGINFRGWPR